MKVARNEKRKKLLGFSFYINIGNFEVFLRNLNLSAKHLFWRCAKVFFTTILKISACISAPIATISLFTTLLIFVALFKESTKDLPDDLIVIWKPRVIFEGLSLFNTTIGTFLSIYGFLFLYHRNIEPFDPATLQIISYFFIFHRFLLIGGDLFPSLDRCAAILFPIKYFFIASPAKVAFGKYVLQF